MTNDEGVAAADAAAAASARPSDAASAADLVGDAVVASAAGWVGASETCAPDMVGGTPDSGLPSAEGYAIESGIPYGTGLIKNRYVARTFLEPTQELRAMGVRLKLNPLKDVIEGKRIVVVDDSIVRGTTMVQLVAHAGAARHGRAPQAQPAQGCDRGQAHRGRGRLHRSRHHHGPARAHAALKLNPLKDVIEGKRIVVVDDSIVRGTTMVQLVRMLRQAGAKEIHIRINCPEDVWPCFYGVDTGEQSQLISATKSVEEVCEFIGADTLAFLSVDTLLECVPKGGYCTACFTGEYPVAIPESFGRDKFIEGYTPRNLSKLEPITGRCGVDNAEDRSWEEAHGE